MKNFYCFLSAIMAGICIGIGGTAFLSIENPIIGALFFTVGLFTIITFGFNLFTGKVGYACNNSPLYLIELSIVWVGNLVGTAFVGYTLHLTRIFDKLLPRVTAMCETKLEDKLISIFILSIFCNILMYIAVNGFKNNPHNIGKYLGLFLSVSVFILCGFEHCIANMFYFSFANVWSLNTVVYLLVMTLGNSLGGLIIPLSEKIKVKCNQNN